MLVESLGHSGRDRNRSGLSGLGRSLERPAPHFRDGLGDSNVAPEQVEVIRPRGYGFPDAGGPRSQSNGTSALYRDGTAAATRSSSGASKILIGLWGSEHCHTSGSVPADSLRGVTEPET